MSSFGFLRLVTCVGKAKCAISEAGSFFSKDIHAPKGHAYAQNKHKSNALNKSSVEKKKVELLN